MLCASKLLLEKPKLLSIIFDKYNLCTKVVLPGTYYKIVNYGTPFIISPVKINASAKLKHNKILVIKNFCHWHLGIGIILYILHIFVSICSCWNSKKLPISKPSILCIDLNECSYSWLQTMDEVLSVPWYFDALVVD